MYKVHIDAHEGVGGGRLVPRRVDRGRDGGVRSCISSSHGQIKTYRTRPPLPARLSAFPSKR